MPLAPDLRDAVPLTIPIIGGPAPARLLEARGRLVHVVPGEGSSLRASILVEIWYAARDETVGFRRHEISTLLRQPDVPEARMPKVGAERYMLLPPLGGEAALVQGEMHLEWAEPSVTGRSPSNPAEMDAVTLRTEFSGDVNGNAHFMRPVGSIIEVAATPSIRLMKENRTWAVTGQVDFALLVEFSDGTLGRNRLSVPYVQSIPGDRPLHCNAHILVDIGFVTGRLADSGLSASVSARIGGQLLIVERRIIDVWQPEVLPDPQYSRRSVIVPVKRELSRTKSCLATDLAIPGHPLGRIDARLQPGTVQRLARSAVQELSAECDVYFAGEEGEGCHTVHVEDCMIRECPEGSMGLESEIRLTDGPVLTANLHGQWRLSMEVEQRLMESQPEALDIIEGPPGEAGQDILAAERLAFRPIRILLETPGPLPADTSAILLDFECRPERGCCRLEGRLEWQTYDPGPGGAEVMTPRHVRFSEDISMPESEPDLEANARLSIAAIDLKRPLILIEGEVSVLRRRIIRVMTGETVRGQGRVFSASVFWNSETLSGPPGTPLRVEAAATDLEWRRDGEILLVKGRVGRLLYLSGPDGRLFCSVGDIPFSAATRIDQNALLKSDFSVRVSRVDAAALPSRPVGGKQRIEEEYRIWFEIAGEPKPANRIRDALDAFPVLRA